MNALLICDCRCQIFEFRHFWNYYLTIFILWFFFLWRYSPNLGLGLPPWNSPFHLGFLDLRQSVGLLGQVISSYTHTNTKHPCPEWDLNSRSQLPSERRQCMPYTARLLWPAYIVISAAFWWWPLIEIKSCMHVVKWQGKCRLERGSCGVPEVANTCTDTPQLTCYGLPHAWHLHLTWRFSVKWNGKFWMVIAILDKKFTINM
jgi:hypothetical protein